eukprot:3778670-Rhodomonas_salina.1
MLCDPPDSHSMRCPTRLVPLNDGDVRLDMPSIHPHADPRSPGSPTSELGSPGARGIYSPAKAAKEWHSIVPDDLPWGNFSAFATGKSLPPREGVCCPFLF